MNQELRIKNKPGKIFYFLFVFFIFNFLFFISAADAAIGVSPKRLVFKLEETDMQKIFIENLNNYPVQILIQAGKNPERIKFSSRQTTLPPGTLQDINVEITGSKSFADEIEVIAYEEAGDELTIQTGIKIPVKVSNSSGAGNVIAAIAAAATATLVFLITRRKNSPLPPD